MFDLSADGMARGGGEALRGRLRCVAWRGGVGRAMVWVEMNDTIPCALLSLRVDGGVSRRDAAGGGRGGVGGGVFTHEDLVAQGDVSAAAGVWEMRVVFLGWGWARRYCHLGGRVVVVFTCSPSCLTGASLLPHHNDCGARSTLC